MYLFNQKIKTRSYVTLVLNQKDLTNDMSRAFDKGRFLGSHVTRPAWWLKEKMLNVKLGLGRRTEDVMFGILIGQSREYFPP